MIRQLSNRSLALDLYVWLAWRCHQLAGPIAISWPALNAQFGHEGRQLRHFKPLFAEALGAATAAYPGARVSLEDQGIIISPAPPPIAKIA